MIKTKQLSARYINFGKPNQKYISLDEVINEFLHSEKIDSERLIDIKYSPVGYFQPDNGDGELEGSALVIYKNTMQ
ncbi:sporulation protein Cse60 [Siminovitchia fordii]|uniref:sporulation protein Cse60 n=1 Tax=Siminovitchia fordii TaxID=254759 RepID=UPI001BB3BC2A|nr:sporulation protein Cse60 [Siminovitchia fordii]